MKKLLGILLILFLSCEESGRIDTSFFYNTIEYKDDLPCGHYQSGHTWIFDLNSNRKIYSCRKLQGTSFFVVNENLTETLNTFHFKYEEIYPWTLTYDSERIIGIKSYSKNGSTKTELVSININNGSFEKLMDLPNSNYRFSEHPISSNGILVVKNDTRKMFLFDIINGHYSKLELESSNRPVISKNGMELLFIDKDNVHLYNIERETFDKLFFFNEEKNYRAFNAFFGGENRILVKGIKNEGWKPLQEVVFYELDKTTGEKLGEGKVNIRNGFKYK